MPLKTVQNWEFHLKVAVVLAGIVVLACSSLVMA